MSPVQFATEVDRYREELISVGGQVVHDSLDLSRCRYEDIMRVLPVESQLRQHIKEMTFVFRYGGGPKKIQELMS